jgi:pimeloyl-ACP methyl ester carboxylesterase
VKSFIDSLKNEYNIVYFHLRGSGYSQFPESNSYDQYLRTRYAVEDIEHIRENLDISRWYGVVGYSYGTVLAQEYTGKYGAQGKVNKLVLLKPLSRRGIKRSEDAVNLINMMREKDLQTLKQILVNEFNNPNGYQERIESEVANIMERVDDKFGGVQFVIDEYQRLKSLDHDLLKEHSLDYSKPFFVALRGLRDWGWLPDGNLLRHQRYLGLMVTRELACKMGISNFKQDIGERIVSYCSIVDITNKLASIEFSTGFDLPEESNSLPEDKREIRTLRQIYATAKFGDLSSDQTEMIIDETERILERVDAKFGGLTTVIQRYEKLTESPDRHTSSGEGRFASRGDEPNALQKESLDYKLDFFRALQSLTYDRRRFLGMSAAVTEQYQQYAGVLIGKEIACKIAQKMEATNEFSGAVPNPLGETTSLCDAVDQFEGKQEGTSKRVYNVVSAYDGLNLRFLKYWLPGTFDIRTAFRMSAGEVHFDRCGNLRSCRDETNKYVEKIGTDNSGAIMITAWDPAESSHSVPTLILAGDADSVTAGMQPEHFYTTLKGERTLIRLPGIGHLLYLPDALTKDRPIDENDKNVCYGKKNEVKEQNKTIILFRHENPEGCLLSLFLTKEFKDIVPMLKGLEIAFQRILDHTKLGRGLIVKVCHKDGENSMPSGWSESSC